jgi:GTP pyrophosphokinase
MLLLPVAKFLIQNIMIIMPNVKELISTMPNHPSEKGVGLITRAYEVAEKAHEGHKRYSGEPHFVHVYETAKKLAELGMGPTTISAGLLHDSVEDTDLTAEEIEKEFGREILFLVEGVTKLGHLKYRGAERHTESLRKLFVATSQDVRVLIIKLADRLHNIKTLEFVPKPEKRDRIAKETLEIYVPLAYRLGVRALHREMEDYAFKHAYPEEYEKASKLLKSYKHETTDRLDKIHKSIKKAFAKEGLTDIRTYSRIKGLYSLHKKLLRKGDIEKIYDIAALRVIVPTVGDCYTALGIIHSHWRPLPDRIRDYIAFPKPNGYQSLHTTIFTGDGGIVEVQIRSKQMHREAEYGIASHLSYKEGFKKKTVNPNLLWIRQLLPKRNSIDSHSDGAVSVEIDIPDWLKKLGEEQREAAEPHDFIKRLKADFFERRIFVFTPKGDVIDLPVGSSPIDFAYAVHSEIGDHVSGSKVNGKMVSLDTVLVNGDIVQIETKKTNKPTQKWLEFAKTSLARRHIRQVLQKKD